MSIAVKDMLKFIKVKLDKIIAMPISDEDFEGFVNEVLYSAQHFQPYQLQSLSRTVRYDRRPIYLVAREVRKIYKGVTF